MKTFKLLLIVFLIFPLVSSAQRGEGRKRAKEKKAYETNLKYYNEIFGKNDPDFDITESPKEWNTEPIVMLCQKVHISFLRDTKKDGSQTKGVIRKRVLIQDKAALEDFSEFYYQNSSAFGIQHIKPDGTKKNIDLKNAVKVESDIPNFYADSYHSEDYNKIAIPDLEVGDILDYFKVFTETYRGNIELIAPISYSYPVVSQEIIFDVDKLWNFFYNTFNGAPEFVQDQEGGIDIKGRKRKIIKRFVLRSTDQKAQKEERWDFINLTEPIIKVMALAPNSVFAGKKRRNEITNSIDIRNLFKSDLNNGQTVASTIVSTTQKRLKSIGIKKMLKEEKANTIYTALRLDFINQSLIYRASIAAGVSTSSRIKPTLNSGSMNADTYFSMKSNVFAGIFSNLLNRYDIESEIVQVVPRYFGDYNNVITKKEIEYGVYIPSIDRYYWTLDNYRNPIDINYDMAGATGYKIPRRQLNRRGAKFSKITIPESHPNDNISLTKLNIQVKEDNSFDVNKVVEYTGRYKEVHNSLFLFQVPILEEDFEKLTSEKDRAKMNRTKNRKSYRNVRKKNDIKKDELSERKKEAIEDWLKDDFEVEKFENYEVLSHGRFPDNNILSIETNFTAKGYLQKAGPNLIFSIGKLIAGQIALEEDEINDRNKPIELEYARTIKNEIQINLPEGYQVKGIDALNMNVDNSFAAFLSEASQEGNVLSLKTTKTYKKQYISKTDWKQLVEMLEAAYKFSQKKIILKK